MSEHTAADIDKHVRIYITVFVALMVLTIVTVAISRFHLPVHLAVTLALVVATIKGALVACYFMHLISEKKLIYAVLALGLGAWCLPAHPAGAVGSFIVAAVLVGYETWFLRKARSLP